MHLAESGSTAARTVLAVLNDNDAFSRYISTAQVGITLASLGLGMYGEQMIAAWFLPALEYFGWPGIAAAHSVAAVLAVILLTYFHVVLGEMVPKSLALQSAALTAIRLSAIMTTADKLFRPLTAVLNWCGAQILRMAGMPAAAQGSKICLDR